MTSTEIVEAAPNPVKKTRVWVKPVAIMAGFTALGLGIGGISGYADFRDARNDLAAAEACRDFVQAHDKSGVADHVLEMKWGDTTYEQRRNCGLAYEDYLFVTALGTKYEVSAKGMLETPLEFPSLKSLNASITEYRHNKDNAFGDWTIGLGEVGLMVGGVAAAIALVLEGSKEAETTKPS